eukprot:Gb_26764 [translate_table: standard]
MGCDCLSRKLEASSYATTCGSAFEHLLQRNLTSFCTVILGLLTPTRVRYCCSILWIGIEMMGGLEDQMRSIAFFLVGDDCQFSEGIAAMAWKVGLLDY